VHEGGASGAISICDVGVGGVWKGNSVMITSPWPSRRHGEGAVGEASEVLLVRVA